jgi:hypothetical protein
VEALLLVAVWHCGSLFRCGLGPGFRCRNSLVVTAMQELAVCVLDVECCCILFEVLLEAVR